jgi:D-alanyl-D-alanine carboxypeptidase
MQKLPHGTPLALGSLLVALCAVVGYALYDHIQLSQGIEEARFELASSTTSFEIARAKQQSLLRESETQRQVLSSSLEAEQRKNGNFQGQIESISSTVSTLTKLSQTDSQLLAKYSKVYFLNENYSPASLSTIDKRYAYQTDRIYEFNSEALPFLEDLLEKAEEDTIDIQIVSGYRSFASQKSLKSTYTVRYGTTAANAFSADQGYSEHQLGTAVDFTTRELAGTFVGFDKSSTYTWLQENAHKYGFILSYPKSNGFYIYEPWHWRFVGVALAEDLHKSSKNFYEMDQRELNTYLIKLFDH